MQRTYDNNICDFALTRLAVPRAARGVFPMLASRRLCLCRLPAPPAACLPRIAGNRLSCVGARALCAPAKPAAPTPPPLPPQLSERGLGPLHRALLFLWDPSEPALIGRVAAAVSLMIAAKRFHVCE